MKLRVLLPLALLAAPFAAPPAAAVCEPAACLQITYAYATLEAGRLAGAAHGIVVSDGGAFGQATYGTVVTCAGRWVALLVQEPTSGRIVPVTLGCAQTEAGHATTYAGRIVYHAGVVARFVPEDAQRFVGQLLA
ncbi:MAG TPA: hypothetical protein VNX21_03880 [Candidatus Thermoplasmatota archaeon]|nr:hypothetical protein [Candidatus Thermoplasmatota archaeon]